MQKMGAGREIPPEGCFMRTCTWIAFLVVFVIVVSPFPVSGSEKQLSDAEISREILKESNKVIIEAFLKAELREVNEYATVPLLKAHPSLVFFIKQVDRGPLESLFFLEEQVHKLQEAQRNIDSLAMTLAFSEEERKKLMRLKPVADKIISFGIPLMKRDFFIMVQAARVLAEEKRKHPVQLIADPAFRDAIYRKCEPTPQGLDKTLGELSEGELICMQLGWVLETITVTRWWLTFNDNTLPERDDFMAYRKKRSEYFQKRLVRIYGKGL
jgi:hypothetical protein